MVVLARFVACSGIWVEIWQLSWTMYAFWHQIVASFFQMEVTVFPFVGGGALSLLGSSSTSAPGGSRTFHVPHPLVRH